MSEVAWDNTTRRFYEVCDVELGAVENWLLASEIDIGGAKTVRVELQYHAMNQSVYKKCRKQGRDCMGVLELHAASLGQGEELQEEWQRDKKWYQIFLASHIIQRRRYKSLSCGLLGSTSPTR